jgi:hypothetical protein
MRQPAWWRQTPRQIQLFTYILVPLGAVLLCGGLWLDHTGSWTGHEFLLNVTSSFTGLCFGGPTAVLLFNRLGHAQDKARQEDQARQRAGTEAAAFRQALLSAFTAPDLADLTGRIAMLEQQIDDARSRPKGDEVRDQNLAEFLSGFDTLLPSLSGAPRRNLRFGHRSDELMRMEDWRTRIVNRWNILHREVRPALPGNSWIAEGPDTAAQQAAERILRADRNPWREKPTADAAERAVHHFLRDVNALCQAATALEAYR